MAAAARHRRRITQALVLWVALGQIGCSRGDEQVQSRRVLDRIERMRLSAADEREPHIQALASQPAEHPLASRAKQQCLEAYRALAESRQLEARARQSLREGRPGTDAAAEALAAEDALAQATRAMPQCDAAVAELRRLLDS